MMYDGENKFKKEYDKVLEKIKEIFNTEDIEVLNFINYSDSISFLVIIGDFCILDLRIDDKKANKHMYDIFTENNLDMNNVDDTIKNIYKLIEECNK